eukprot:2539941-Pyramimonas_sp.AAC.1
MMTNHFDPKKADLWRDLLELSLIFPFAPMQCPPRDPWRPLRGPRRPDGLPHIAELPKVDGCEEGCDILLTGREIWGAP